VGGADGYAEPDGDLGEGVVLAQVGESDEGTRELAAAVTLTGAMSIVTHSTSA
jgi:hypothetical protein